MDLLSSHSGTGLLNGGSDRKTRGEGKFHPAPIVFCLTHDSFLPQQENTTVCWVVLNGVLAVLPPCGATRVFYYV